MEEEDIKKIAEGLEEIHEEESEIKKGVKKIYIFIIAVFLIILILGSSLAGSHLIFQLNGKISSVNAINNTLSFGSRTIFFEPDIYARLKQEFNDNQKTEIKLCLTGKREGDNYFVSGMYSPLVYKKDVFSITSQMCSRETIVDLHTHPYLHCIFSNQDMDSYRKYLGYNPDAIMALMCDENRFSIYGY